MNKRHKHAKIIEALGGVRQVAREIGRDHCVVANWVTRGISRAGLYEIAALAAQKRVELPKEFPAVGPLSKNEVAAAAG